MGSATKTDTAMISKKNTEIVSK